MRVPSVANSGALGRPRRAVAPLGFWHDAATEYQQTVLDWSCGVLLPPGCTNGSDVNFIAATALRSPYDRNIRPHIFGQRYSLSREMAPCTQGYDLCHRGILSFGRSLLVGHGPAYWSVAPRDKCFTDLAKWKII